MNKTEKFIKENKDRFIDELFQFIKIPSISSEPEHKQDMIKAAEYLYQRLIEAGVDKAEVSETLTNPIVYGEKTISPEAKTILVYGHYDVMPVEPLNEWKTDPFKAVIKDGAIWARGADDDKGQIYLHIKAFEAMCKTGELPCNVKFMFEGEEEIGSGALAVWCKENKERLKADIILVSDTGMISEQTPSITCGLRGIAYFDLKITGPCRDLHSGLYGGAVANPINVLASIIAKLTDQNGRITIPGFYDKVKVFTQAERDIICSVPFSEERFMKLIGVDGVSGEEGYTTYERKGIRPTLDVCGIKGGYTGEGAKTIIASEASAKVSMRLVANQDYKEIAQAFTSYVQTLVPNTGAVKVDVKFLHGGAPYMADTKSQAYISASKAIGDAFGTSPVPFYSGGSIAIISLFEQELGLKSILMGFGLDTDSTHAPNENFRLSMFDKALKTIPLFYKYFSQN